jgi:hypothetical protein
MKSRWLIRLHPSGFLKVSRLGGGFNVTAFSEGDASTPTDRWHLLYVLETLGRWVTYRGRSNEAEQ